MILPYPAATTKPLFFDPYTTNRITGSLILIDEATNETVAAGMNCLKNRIAAARQTLFKSFSAINSKKFSYFECFKCSFQKTGIHETPSILLIGFLMFSGIIRVLPSRCR